MQRLDPIDARLPWIRALGDLREARAVSNAGPKLSALTTAGRKLGDDLRAEPRVVSCRSFPLTTLLYPTRYAFAGATKMPVPFVVMTHRAMLVQVDVEGDVKNVLFNPTDVDAARETPFFKHLIAEFGAWASEKAVTRFDPLITQLAAVGVQPSDIDVIAYDHFHTQDVRRVLGTAGGVGLFPNALLLAPRNEWQAWDMLHPMQRAWFVREGKMGVSTSRVVLFDDDIVLGQGCMILRTPGHTIGNQTLFVHTHDGVFGTSENGTSADSWSPHASKILGLKAYAALYGLDAIINSNTPELGAEQYTSMMLERSVVDVVADAPEFAQMFPSSEVTPSVLAPGISPTMLFREKATGSIRPPASRASMAP